MALGIVFLVIFIALAFEYINGFHDTANSIATVVGTKVLTPRQAILLAATTNLMGALAGHAVAKTVSSGLVDAHFVSPLVIAGALLGGITWNLITWWFALPSSSTHALVGGICGATVAAAGNHLGVIIWSVEKVQDGKIVMDGVFHKVIVPMIASPLLGLIGGYLIMGVLYFLLASVRPHIINRFFAKAQIGSAGYMGFAHGLADAQKTMGVITLALVTATSAGTFSQTPEWLDFLKMEKTMASDQSIKSLLKPDASPVSLRSAASVLETEALKLSPGEFREAFLSLSSRVYYLLGDTEAASRTKQEAADTHAALLTAEGSRLLPRIPLVGRFFAWHYTYWAPELDQVMAEASNSGHSEIIAAATKVGELTPDVPIWIKILCSLTMAAGTMAGGWRIIKTLGHKMVKLQPVHGFAAETTAATILAVTGGLGMTVSTTHCVTTAIMGVGSAKRSNAVKLSLVEKILWAWVLTLPAAAAAAYIYVEIFRLFGWMP